MSVSTESHFAAEYSQALAAHLRLAGSVDMQRANDLGDLARSLNIPFHEIVAHHADSLSACLPDGAQLSDYKAATEFLGVLCQVTEAADASEREQFVRKLAHAVRTPLTTLRLSLQVGVGQLEKGEPIAPTILQRSIAQVDKLTAQIGELFNDYYAKVSPRRSTEHVTSERDSSSPKKAHSALRHPDR